MSSQHDHRVLNRDLEIFYSLEEMGSGLPGWAPRGMIVRQALERWLQDLENEEGYRRLGSPVLAPEALYRRSGHLGFYDDGMFAAIDGLRLRPMSCPHHHLYFGSRPRSEKELPFRIAEFGQVFRDEPSGSLLGFQRARSFSQNDGHVYVLPEDAKAEVRRVLRLHLRVYEGVGLAGFRFRLSRAKFEGPGREKFAPLPEAWERAEGILREALLEEGLEFFEAPGEAAFYGPKIDVQLRSARGSEESVASIQLDFLAEKSFGLEVLRADGARAPVWVIHRAPIGSFERFVAFLLERDAGWLPFWLSPEQVLIAPVGDRHHERARELAAELRRRGVRASVDERAESLSRKIRDAHRMRIPVVGVVGDRELESGAVAAREREGSFVMSSRDFVERAAGRAAARSL